MGMASFGEALRHHRMAAGLSQEELAERAGLSTKAIGALERGARRHPYPHTVRALADALGLTEDERAALHAATARSSAVPAVAVAEPAPPAQDRAPSVPAQLSALIGREREVAIVRHLLERPGTRLLTLTGPGGVGKTRLALRVAEEVGANFPDGIAFLALAPLAEPALVLDAIARALAVTGLSDASPLDTLVSALRGRRLLLLLDNFEHLTDAAPDVAALLAACPSLVVLVTSRSPLRVRGEQEYRVPPLDLPQPGIGTDPDAALASDAVRLFVARARESQADFALTPANTAAVVAICRRLDGLPLALELAAARIGLLPPAALLGRLDRALPLLADGPRDLPARQRTMRDAIAWSHDLLTPKERATFARLAVFAGGGTLDAAEAICADADAEAPAALDRVATLLRSNLLVRDGTSGGEEGPGSPRVRMLEPIREFAEERLAADSESADLRRRHAEYYLALVEGERVDQSAWLRRVGPEHDNLRAALRWAFGGGGDAHLGLRLAAALWWFWEVRGHLTDGRAWLERALAAEAGPPTSLRAEAYFGAGALAIRQRDYAAADAFDEQSLAIWRALDDPSGIARALTALAEVALRRGDQGRASALLAESVALRRALGDNAGLAESVNLAGLVARDTGDYARAQDLFEECLVLWRELQRPWGISIVLGNLGHLGLRQGDEERAAALLGECLALSWELGASWNIAYGLEGLAGVAARRGEVGRAARMWGAAEALREAIGAPLPPNLAPYHDEQVAAARALAAEMDWDTAWATGRAMPLEGAVAEGLQPPG